MSHPGCAAPGRARATWLESASICGLKVLVVPEQSFRTAPVSGLSERQIVLPVPRPAALPSLGWGQNRVGPAGSLGGSWWL